MSLNVCNETDVTFKIMVTIYNTEGSVLPFYLGVVLAWHNGINEYMNEELSSSEKRQST